jgi:hypothetical protein
LVAIEQKEQADAAEQRQQAGIFVVEQMIDCCNFCT